MNVTNMAKQAAKRRLMWWLAGLGFGVLLPILGWGFLFLLIIAAFFMVFGGLGYHAQKVPPPLPTQAVYSSQWLGLVQHVDTANGFFTQYPAVIWIAAIASTSGGMPLDRTSAKGYGLFDLPIKTNMAHPLAATNAFALDLRRHIVPSDLQATLNAVGQTLSPAHSNWSATIKSRIQSLERGPQIAAWPVVMTWQRVITSPTASRFGVNANNSSVQWQYPAHHAIDIVATASAPVGNAYSVAWTPPYTVCLAPPPHSNKKPKCHVVRNDLTGNDLQAPLSMTLKTSTGRVVPMIPVEGPSKTDGFVFNHAVLYVTKAKVVVNTQHPATITATWSGGLTVSTKLPGSGFNQGSGGPVGPTPPPGNPKTLQQIWNNYQSDITSASQATGVPASVLVGEINNETHGVNYAYRGGGVACGLFQMFSPGSFTEFAPPGTPAKDCAVPSVEALAAARYLQYQYNLFGSRRAASAGYYGGQGSVASSGVHAGMSWAQDNVRLNWVPSPGAGNTETMSQYANAMWAAATQISHLAHLPPP